MIGAGWYDDGSGSPRWWDGTRWTEHTLDQQAQRTGQAQTSAPPRTRAGWYDDGSGQWRWWDGSTWSQHTAPIHRERDQEPDAAPTKALPEPGPQKRVITTHHRRTRRLLIVGVVLAGFVIQGVAATADLWVLQPFVAHCPWDPMPKSTIPGIEYSYELFPGCTAILGLTIPSWLAGIGLGLLTGLIGLVGEWMAERGEIVTD